MFSDGERGGDGARSATSRRADDGVRAVDLVAERLGAEDVAATGHFGHVDEGDGGAEIEDSGAEVFAGEGVEESPDGPCRWVR